MASFVLCLAFAMLGIPIASAQYAKSTYYTDTKADCQLSGSMLLKTNAAVTVSSRNPNTNPSDLLSCRLQFRPEDSKAIMDVRFNYFSISDCNVILQVELTGVTPLALSCTSATPMPMVAENGLVNIYTARKTLDNRDYSFSMTLRTYLKDDSSIGQDEKPVAVGLIVGIVGGIIAILIIFSIIGVCCYRKKKKQYRDRMGGDRKTNLTETISPKHSYAYTDPSRNGTMRNEMHDNEDSDTPSSKKKLLISSMYPMESGSESDTKDAKDIHIISQFDSSPTRSRGVNNETQNGQNKVPVQNVQMRNRQPADASNKPANAQPNSSPKSPILSALHNNPRFRASFHENEADADERARRISGNHDPGVESDGSEAETWDTTFDTQFSDDEHPAQSRVSKPPKPPPLPIVPKSPKAPERRQQTATIRRAPRPSSSASDIEQMQQNNAEGDSGVKLMHENELHSSSSEIIPIRVKDPHTPTSNRKLETQHTLRPQRGQRQQSPENRKKQEPSAASKSSKTETKKGPDLVTGSEHEGRFKKANSKGKGKPAAKSPRFGRSRSTGSALDEAGSSRNSANPNKVPIVTADDYEDSDVESNYNPLHRSGSKNSLYASRSSLYGRRRRKNSVGESIASTYDDIDYHRPDRGSFSEQRGLSRRDRGFKSLGDLEREMSEQATRGTQTLRECATQTGTGFANVTPSKKMVVKRSKPRSVTSHTTQTAKGHERTNSGSSATGLSKPRERKNSASSTSGKAKQTKKELENKKKKPSESESKSVKSETQAAEKLKPKPQPKPKPLPRKSTVGGNVSEDDMDGPIDQSSTVGVLESEDVAQPPISSGYPPQSYPAGYPMGFMPPMGYIPAPGQPPVMMPMGAYPAMGPMHTSAVAPYPNALVPNAGALAPVTTRIPNPAAGPAISKWDMLCKMTDGESVKGGDSYESGSVFSQSAPYPAYLPQGYVPPSYSSAMSDYYAGSERSGPRSTSSVLGRSPGRSAWGTLQEMADNDYNVSYGGQATRGNMPPDSSC